MKIVELKTSAELARIFPLIKQHNPWMTKPLFTKRLNAMIGDGYRCIAAMEGKKIQGICGFWIGTQFWCGKYVEMDNVIVDEKIRGSGIGAEMLKWVEEEGKRLGCDVADMPVYTHGHRAQRFYFRNGYIIEGYYFTKRFYEKEKPELKRRA